jgi:hypothetical protein
MLRTISSVQTFFVKCVFAPVWVAGFGVGTLAVFTLPLHPGAPPLPVRFLFLAAWLFGSSFMWKTLAVLKRVRMDDRTLYVSNFRTEVAVPLVAVTAVRENKWLNYHPVTIEFETDTPFGRSITFMPTARFAALWKSHPIVRELRDAARRAKSRATAA